MESIIVAIIAAAGSLIGTMCTNKAATDKIASEIEKQQAVTETRLDELTREVREHNNFAKRMPVVEEQIKVINHRIKDLEREE